MKKFTTTFFLLMAMVLLLPTEMKAQGHEFYLLCGDNSWEKNDNFKFSKPDQSKEVFEFTLLKKQISSTNVKDGYFYVRVRPYYDGNWWNNKNEICPQNDGDELTSTLSPAKLDANKNLAWKVKYDDNATKYTFTLDRTSPEINKIKVVTGSGGGETSSITFYVSTANEPYIYIWDPSNSNKEYSGKFPGKKGSDYPHSDFDSNMNIEKVADTNNNTWYKVLVTGTSNLNLILNNGSSGEDNQTENITIVDGYTYTYNNGNRYTKSEETPTFSGGETTTTTTAYIKYGDNEAIASISTESPYVFTIPKSEYNDNSGISFALQTVKTTTTGGNTTTEYTNYTGTGLKNNSTGVDYTATTVTDGSYGANWEYMADEGKEPTGNITVTLNTTTTKKVSLKHAVAGTTPVTSENYYLVGNFFTDDGNNINYDRKIFRFEPDGLGNYTLDIPATLTVDCQVIGVKDGVVTVYAPSGAYEIKGDCPNDDLAVSGTLATTTLGDASNKWSFTTRNLTSDGIYTITLSESATKWDIKHNGNKRMAYYLSTMDGATAQPSYTEDRGSWVTTNGKPAYDNRYFGYIYLEKDAKCWIISNLLTQFDNGNSELSKTTTKLYYQGNKEGEIGGGDQKAIVFPKGTSPYTPQPFTIGNTTKDLSVMLEYNPTQGHNNGDYSYELGNEQTVSGRVQKANSTDAAGSSLPEITSMQILGPGVNGSWNVNEAIPMTYNPTERCWQATVYTNKEESEGNLFRFIVNNSLMYNFGDDETKARVPYLTATDGVSALPSDPNKVIYHKESPETKRTGDDIIFNRPAGEWTVRFYITQNISGANGKYTYDFKYTIDGREYNDEVTIPSAKVGEKYVLLRTYSNIIDCKPVDDNVHIFVAHNFAKDGTDTKYGAITGKVHLYEINYIPANTGVVLYVGEGKEALTVKLVQASDINSTNYTKSLTNKDYLWKWKENHASESFNNDLVAVLTSTKVGPSVIENDEIVARNFGLGKFSSTKDYKEDTDTDRIGFFRLMEGTMGGHKAYLQYDKGQYGIDGNSQILDKETDVNTVTFSKVMLIFEGFDDNETTGINEIISATDKAKDVYYYNLQGIRVTNPSKGIYINNGKKVIIK